MSRGLQGPQGPNHNDTIGLGAPHCPLYMAPEGLATLVIDGFNGLIWIEQATQQISIKIILAV